MSDTASSCIAPSSEGSNGGIVGAACTVAAAVPSESGDGCSVRCDSGKVAMVAPGRDEAGYVAIVGAWAGMGVRNVDGSERVAVSCSVCSARRSRSLAARRRERCGLSRFESR